MNILLTGCFNYSDEQIKVVKDLGLNICFLQYECDDLPIPAKYIDISVCNALFQYHSIDEFSNLKCIQLTSAGFDRAPLEKINHRGIVIYNARDVYSIPMAEWALFRILERYKKGPTFNAQQDNKQWLKQRDLTELFNKKVGIIGAGSVGREVAKRLKAFGCQTAGFDIVSKSIPFFDCIYNISSLENVLPSIDILISTVPLLPSTFHLISIDVLNKLKNGSMIVNLSRGSIIDESELTRFLMKRKDVFAILDVFETEPLSINSPLWSLSNVAISPHNSFVSDGNNKRMFDVIYNNLKNFLNFI